MANKNSFEASLMRLESAVEKLESADLPLDEALKVFSDGVKQAGICRKALSSVEIQVEQLLKTADGHLVRETFDEPS